MRYYPLFTDLQGRACLVVGEGRLCEEKARQLSRAGAIVRRAASFHPDHATDVFLIIADVEAEEGKRIREYGDRRSIFVNIVDKTELCSFIAPAIVEQEDLLIAISSSGKSPALSAWIRRRLEREFGKEYGEMLGVLGELRRHVQQALPNYQDRKDFYRKLFEAGLVEEAHRGGCEAVRRKLLQKLDQVFHGNPA